MLSSRNLLFILVFPNIFHFSYSSTGRVCRNDKLFQKTIGAYDDYLAIVRYHVGLFFPQRNTNQALK